jgi:hypothetical protein
MKAFRIFSPIHQLFLALELLALICAGCSLLRSGSSSFREFYVSPTGADTYPGTKAKPFQTLARARDAVRAVNRHMTGNIVVYLRGGTYPVTAPVDFTSADSGCNGFKVVYRAFDQEAPILSGGVLVTNWSLDHNNIYRANLDWDGKLRSLYVNGVRASLTRADFKGQGPWGEFIVKGDEPWAETPGKTLDGIRFNSAELPVFSNASDVEVLQHRVWNFLVMGAREMSVEGNYTVVKLQQPYGAIAATMAWHCNLDPTNKFTLRNAYELLKSPGQFYFNRATHTLYYFAKQGEDMSAATVIAPLSEGLVRIAGVSTNDRARNLVFTGLTFSYDHWLLKQIGDSRGMVGVQSLGLYTRFRADGNWHKDHYDLCDLPQATVDLRNCDNIRFERNRFTHLAGGVAISLVNDVVDSAVVGNVFYDLSGNAINIGHPQHYIIGDGPLFNAGIEGVCARIQVKNNLIRNASLDFKQEEAISGFFTESVEISHNDIRGVPYGGIALGWWWGNGEIPPSKVSKNNIISCNRVVDTQQELYRDGGAIYVLGEQPGGRIESNYVRSITRSIYPDDGSAYWTISNNVLDPRDNRDIPVRKQRPWLFLWTPRIHDLKVDNNYTTVTNITANATNTVVTNTHFEPQFSPAAQGIATAAGLEPAYKDIAKTLAEGNTANKTKRLKPGSL